MAAAIGAASAGSSGMSSTFKALWMRRRPGISARTLGILAGGNNRTSTGKSGDPGRSPRRCTDSSAATSAACTAITPNKITTRRRVDAIIAAKPVA